MNRRDFITNSSLVLLASALPGCAQDRPYVASPEEQSDGDEAHFLINLCFLGAADPFYMFDARPLTMTAANLVQNYLGVEPKPWMGSNGQSSLTFSTTDMLLPFKDDFSVLNGVFMSTSFEGHDQSINLFLTGNPFGGELFNPHLNYRNIMPLGCVQFGTGVATLTNGGSIVPLSTNSLAILKKKIDENEHLVSSFGPAYSYLQKRVAELGVGEGVFSSSVKLMETANANSPRLARRLKVLELPEVDITDTWANELRHIFSTFKSGVSKSALIYGTVSDVLDTHAPDQAKNQPKLCTEITTKIATMIRLLKSTPYDRTRSMYDVTTFIVGSEFGRTMKQRDFRVDATGTDHNSFSNSYVIGGKKIKGGLVLGASDFKTASETLSEVHIKLDPEKKKIMGRPFDFATNQVVNSMPTAYKIGDYLNSQSVVNTIFDAFDQPKSYYRPIEKDGPLAPVITGLRA